MLSEENSYVSKTTASLLYHTKASMIESIEERRPDRVVPTEKSSGYIAGQTCSVTITNDQVIDPQSACLNFRLNEYKADAATADAGYINSATDVIRKWSVYYNDTLIEEFDQANYWTNVFLYFSANRSWFETEGRALLGLAPRYLTAAATNVECSTSLVEDFTIPLALISPFLRNKFMIPLFGARLRFTIVLAENKEVLTNYTTALDIYMLNNVSFTYDTIILTPAYRQALIAQLRSSEGIRIPYTSYDTKVLSCIASSTQNIRFNYNLVNALSLFMLHNPTALKAVSNATYNYQAHGFPLGGVGAKFVRLDVTSGTRRFTPNDGIKTMSELYASAEKCVGSLCDISGSGIVDRTMFSDPYVQHGTYGSAKAGLCLYACNLEKTTENDDSLINSGISSTEGFNQMDVRLEMDTVFVNTSEFLINMVHKRVLKLSASGTQLDF